MDGLARPSRNDRWRHLQTAIHRRGLRRVRAHDSARSHVDIRHDPAAWRPPLAGTPPTYVRVVHRRRHALLVARQGGRSKASRVRYRGRDSAYIPTVLDSRSRSTAKGAAVARSISVADTTVARCFPAQMEQRMRAPGFVER